ncbi:MAG: cobyrinate a,c-diamide synthase, partial [Clostridia bacterium]|nr:cobyrinate a,c-diamide synthase [Clostridia bacterium]
MRIPRVMIAGEKSGSGKTTAVCALLALLKRKNFSVRSCKCGPDYIDPTFHRQVLSVPCVNLDPFFCEGGKLRALLCENAGRDLTVVEGVMGYYDGTGGSGTENSSYTVAQETQTPVILVIDGKGAFASLLAVTEGFLNFVPQSRIAGVIFNRVTEHTYARLKKLVAARFGEKVICAGYIPVLPEECVLGSRHLGLITAEETGNICGVIERLADITGNTLDTDAVVRIACSAPELFPEKRGLPLLPQVTIAVARDKAFCFYYSETLALFEKLGAKIEYFSPLADEEIPPRACGLYIGGGYPELHAEALEKAVRTARSVREAVSSGMPTIAECVGFMYLCETIDGKKTCGALPGGSKNAGKLVRFGYAELETKRKSLFGNAGTVLKAHEFLYYESDFCGNDCKAVKTDGKLY